MADIDGMCDLNSLENSCGGRLFSMRFSIEPENWRIWNNLPSSANFNLIECRSQHITHTKAREFAELRTSMNTFLVPNIGLIIRTRSFARNEILAQNVKYFLVFSLLLRFDVYSRDYQRSHTTNCPDLRHLRIRLRNWMQTAISFRPQISRIDRHKPIVGYLRETTTATTQETNELLLVNSENKNFN